MGLHPAAVLAAAACAFLAVPALGARPGLRAGADQRFLHAGSRAVAAAAPSLVPEGGACFGNADKMCMDCGGAEAKGFPGGEACKSFSETCKNSFCSELCLSDAIWRCSASWQDKSDDKDARTNGPLSDAEQRALCAQTKGLACASMGCCKTAEKPKEAAADAGEAGEDGAIDPLREWVVAQESVSLESGVWREPRIGGGVDVGSLMLPVSALPLQRCEHDPADRTTADLLCKTCQGRLKLSVQALPEATRCSALSPAAGDGVPFTQDKDSGAQFSAFDRCQSAAPDLIGALASSDVKTWQQERLCRCAGCCSDPPESKANKLATAVADCPFPTYSMM
ncbi:hypothetical protein FNF27_06069 [Cafeteria roenbergensis]|uniref:Uncharacterized protein n=1 Tax=Cafeteria roenbergensis TaxID=33653 RepID=A0A5A8E8G7_CAFRO|nr:hypothetical protein FNF27_06069 [Cafeteria roenbergensis]